MDAYGKYSISKRVILYEIIGFLSIIIFIWFDEFTDIPYLFLGAEATPLNWRESLFESSIIGILGIVIINYTHQLFKRMKYLEGILPVCASCKKIRDEKGDWQPIEYYIHERSEAEFSHGICPECSERLYPELYLHEIKG